MDYSWTCYIGGRDRPVSDAGPFPLMDWPKACAKQSMVLWLPLTVYHFTIICTNRVFNRVFELLHYQMLYLSEECVCNPWDMSRQFRRNGQKTVWWWCPLPAFSLPKDKGVNRKSGIKQATNYQDVSCTFDNTTYTKSQKTQFRNIWTTRREKVNKMLNNKSRTVLVLSSTFNNKEACGSDAELPRHTFHT